MLGENSLLLGCRQFVPRGTTGNRPIAYRELADQIVNVPGALGICVIPGVEQLQKDPLGPAVEPDVSGGRRSTWIVGEAQLSQLRPVSLDVFFGGRPWVRTGESDFLRWVRWFRR